MDYAFLGTRQPRLLPPTVIDLYRTAAESLAKQGSTVLCGATAGAEQLAAEAALSAGGTVELFLPWALYERDWVQRMKRLHGERVREILFAPSTHSDWLEAARATVPNGAHLSAGSIALHARSYGLLERADAVVMMPYVRLTWQAIERPATSRRSRIGGISGESEIREQILDKGGAEWAIRFAQNLDRVAFDLSAEEDRARLLSTIHDVARVS